MHQETFQNSCVGHSVFHHELEHSICVCAHAQGYHRLCDNLHHFLLTFSLFTSLRIGTYRWLLFPQTAKDTGRTNDMIPNTRQKKKFLVDPFSCSSPKQLRRVSATILGHSASISAKIVWLLAMVTFTGCESKEVEPTISTQPNTSQKTLKVETISQNHVAVQICMNETHLHRIVSLSRLQ